MTFTRAALLDAVRRRLGAAFADRLQLTEASADLAQVCDAFRRALMGPAGADLWLHGVRVIGPASTVEVGPHDLAQYPNVALITPKTFVQAILAALVSGLADAQGRPRYPARFEALFVADCGGALHAGADLTFPTATFDLSVSAFYGEPFDFSPATVWTRLEGAAIRAVMAEARDGATARGPGDSLH